MTIITKEIMLIIPTGIIPTVIIYEYGGIGKLQDFVEASVVADILLYYFLLFFVLHVVLAFLYKSYAERLFRESRKKVQKVVNFIGDIGSGLLGIYRLSAGMLIVIPVMWRILEPDTLSNFSLFVMLSLSLVFFAGLCCISNVEVWARNASNKADQRG